MPAPPSQYRSRYRGIGLSKQEREDRLRERIAQRQRDVKMLTEARGRLIAVRARLGVATPAELGPVPCRLHGIPWTSCELCSPKKGTP